MQKTLDIRSVTNSFLPNNKENVVKDLDKYTKAQLLEMRDRQQAILVNKARLAKLPDKGQRIQDLYDRIVLKLDDKNEIDAAALKFSELNISSKGHAYLTNLEWTGQMESTPLDSDDDVEEQAETDPLKIIAESRSKHKIVKIEKPEKLLITADDLLEIESFKAADRMPTSDVPEEKPENSSRSSSSASTTMNIEVYAQELCEIGDSAVPKERYRPYQTTKTHVHDPEKEVLRCNKASENTAATPPMLRHPGTKLLTLSECLALQIDKDRESKEKHMRDAEARLAEKAKQLKARDFVATNPSDFFKTYRVVDENESAEETDESSDEDQWDSAEEVLDIDAEEEKGGVIYDVHN